MNFDDWLQSKNVIKHWNISEITYENLDNIIGKRVWICDFRLNKNKDIKPIRQVTPKFVKVFSNDELPKGKKVYYSPVHFKELKNGKVLSQVIGPYDNTGYRSYPGVSVNLFDTEKECFEFFREQCDKVILDYQDELNRRTEEINSRIVDIQKMQELFK